MTNVNIKIDRVSYQVKYLSVPKNLNVPENYRPDQAATRDNAITDERLRFVNMHNINCSPPLHLVLSSTGVAFPLSLELLRV